MKKLLLLSLIFLPLTAFAQPAGLIEAWTRGMTNASWKPIVTKTAFAPQVGGAVFYKSLNSAIVPKWVYHIVNYSDVFSKTEKGILLERKPMAVTLGKIAFFHDRSASLYNQLQKEPAPQTLLSQNAFNEHQAKLAQLGSTFENALIKKVAPYLDFKAEAGYEDFVSLLQKWPSNFKRSDIALLFKGSKQPLFPVMSRKEMQEFAQLTDLAAQREWVANAIDLIKINQRSLLSQDPTMAKLTDNQYRLYYLQNLRLEYLNVLQDNVLANATQPRKSLIYRYRSKLTDQLPPMTDAERLGYLHHTLNNLEQGAAERESLQALLKEQNDLYAPYAAAEALELPYEQVLDSGYMSPLLLGEQTADLIKNSADLSKDLAPMIEDLNKQIEMLTLFAAEVTSFYKQYYRLIVERDIYQSALARQHFFDAFRH